MRMKVWGEISGERRSRKLRRAPQEPHRASGHRLVVVCIGACIRHRLDGGVWGSRPPYGSTNKIDEVDRDDFLALAKELDVSPRMVRRLIEEVCEGVGGAASDVLRDTEDALGAPLSKLRDIEEFARSQIDRLGIKGA